jgi:competence protein ComEC
MGPATEEVEFIFGLMERLYAETDRETQKQRLLDLDKNMNNHSAMLMLDFYGTKILLPGDTNCAGYGHLPSEMLKADVFKVGHHGQQDGADKALAETVSPRVLVVCASSDRRYDSMHPEIIGLFKSHDPNVRYLLSDTPNLPPWSDGVPEHRACEITIGEDGSLQTAYIPV